MLLQSLDGVSNQTRPATRNIGSSETHMVLASGKEVTLKSLEVSMLIKLRDMLVHTK